MKKESKREVRRYLTSVYKREYKGQKSISSSLNKIEYRPLPSYIVLSTIEGLYYIYLPSIFILIT